MSIKAMKRTMAAWDESTVQKSCDGRLQQAMEELRQAIEEAEKVEVRAWLIPHLLDLKGAKKVHFTRSEAGANLTDEELTDSLHGTVSWGVSLFGDGGSVTDRYGNVHQPIPLYTTPLARKPLSEGKIQELWNCSGMNPIGFMRAIERAHGIGESAGQEGGE